jgi:toxin YoeB
VRIVFASQAQADYDYWRKSGNKSILDKINRLLIDISEHPYTGIGKPEPLKYELTGKWSRRINSEHRIIYSVQNDVIAVSVFSMRYHYSK